MTSDATGNTTIAPKSPRLEFRPGAEVVTSEGRVGDLLQVVVSPRERRIRTLIVRLSSGREVEVPAERVDDAVDTVVSLTLTRAELEALPPWTPDRFTSAALSWPGWRGLLQGGGLLGLSARLHRHEGLTRRIAGDAAPRPEERVATIHRGQRVVCLDGPIGRVDLVLVDAVTDRVHHIVVRQGLLFSRDVAVPADWVHSITPDAVLLEAPREAVARLPVYRPDDELQRDVEEALLREELVRVLDLPVRVQVEDGIVQLRGYVPNGALRHRVEELVRGVPGVMGIQNDVMVDLDLLQRVTTAIQGHPRARHLVGHQIRVKHGVVELTGGIPSLEAAEALEEAIASVPEVRGIANLLIGPDIPASWRRVLQPEVGQVVAATDQEVGRVSAVVIDPRHRRLQAIVVDGAFPEPGMAPDTGATARARRVVIPLSAVERVTPAGVFLRVHAGRAAGYPDFNDADYPPAPPDWIPPFPYARSRVRVPRDGAERP